jgi:hypothetical protein
MSARITALENNQIKFRNQLSEVLMTSLNNEQALEANPMMLDNLASMVTTIMNRLKSKTTVGQPNLSGSKHGKIARYPPKSACKNQAQSKSARIGASSALPIDVVDVSYVPNEDGNPPKQSVRMMKSKDVKFKGVSGAAGNSEAGMKTTPSEKVSRKKKVTRGGAKQGCGTEDSSVQALNAGGATQEVAPSHGGDMEVGGGIEKNIVGGSWEEGNSGSGGV